jgi:hypothetical protein
MTVPAQAQGTRAKPSESSSGSAPAISGRIVAGASGIGMSQGAQNRGCYVAGGVRLGRPRRRVAGRSVAGGLGAAAARRRPKPIALAILERRAE